MKDLDLSIVFKMRTVEDLGNFYAALKQMMTLQEQHALEKKIKKLKEQEKVMNDTVKRLEGKIRKLSPDEIIKGVDDEKEAVDEAMPEPESPSEEDLEVVELRTDEVMSVPASDERFIVEETEGSIQEREDEDNVQGD